MRRAKVRVMIHSRTNHLSHAHKEAISSLSSPHVSFQGFSNRDNYAEIGGASQPIHLSQGIVQKNLVASTKVLDIPHRMRSCRPLRSGTKK